MKRWRGESVNEPWRHARAGHGAPAQPLMGRRLGNALVDRARRRCRRLVHRHRTAMAVAAVDTAVCPPASPLPHPPPGAAPRRHCLQEVAVSGLRPPPPAVGPLPPAGGGVRLVGAQGAPPHLPDPPSGSPFRQLMSASRATAAAGCTLPPVGRRRQPPRPTRPAAGRARWRCHPRSMGGGTPFKRGVPRPGPGVRGGGNYHCRLPCYPCATPARRSIGTGSPRPARGGHPPPSPRCVVEGLALPLPPLSLGSSRDPDRGPHGGG